MTRRRSRRQHLDHLLAAEPASHHHRPDRRQDRRGETFQARRTGAASSPAATASPATRTASCGSTSARTSRAGMAASAARSQGPRRSPSMLPPTTMSGTPGTHRRRHERQHLGHVARRRAALQHRGREVHRIQVGDLQEQARHRDRLRARRRPHRQRLVAADDARISSTTATSTPARRSEFKLPPEQAVMENLTPEQRKMYETFIPPDFNDPFAWAQGAAPHGRRQERRLRLDRQFLRRQPRPGQHPHQGDHAGAAAEPGGAPALSGAGRQEPQRVDPPVEHRQGREVRSEHVASGRCSTCPTAAPSRATSRCWSSPASRCR